MFICIQDVTIGASSAMKQLLQRRRRINKQVRCRRYFMNVPKRSVARFKRYDSFVTDHNKKLLNICLQLNQIKLIVYCHKNIDGGTK